jgi:hypothetical protein
VAAADVAGIDRSGPVGAAHLRLERGIEVISHAMMRSVREEQGERGCQVREREVFLREDG